MNHHTKKNRKKGMAQLISVAMVLLLLGLFVGLSSKISGAMLDAEDNASSIAAQVLTETLDANLELAGWQTTLAMIAAITVAIGMLLGLARYFGISFSNTGGGI